MMWQLDGNHLTHWKLSLLPFFKTENGNLLKKNTKQLTFLHVDMRKQKKLICNFTFKIHVPV